MPKLNTKRQDSVFSAFFETYLHDGQGRSSVSSALNFTTYQITDPKFFEALAKHLNEIFPDEELAQFNGLEASFGFIEHRFSHYVDKNDFRHENHTVGLLTVRAGNRVCTLSVEPSHIHPDRERSVCLRSFNSGMCDTSYAISVDNIDTELKWQYGFDKIMGIVRNAFESYE